MNGDPLQAAPVGRFRWAVNTAEWQPTGEASGEEVQFLLSLIQEETDYEEVLASSDFEEQKRLLISRLLVRRASAAVLGLQTFDDLDMRRTKGRRPYLRHPRPSNKSGLGNFNFSVSRAGDWVVLASEPLCVVGVDITPPEELFFRQNRQASKKVNIFKDFLDDFTAEEWSFIKQEAERAPSLSGGQAAYPAFQKLWSCKKAFSKARGDGTEFEFDRAGFDLKSSDEHTCEGSGPAYISRVSIDDLQDNEWLLIQHELARGYCVTVARGPTSDVVDAVGEFSSLLLRRTHEFTKDQWQAELSQRSPPFIKVPVSFLVPEVDLPGYHEVAGSSRPVPSAITERSDGKPPPTHRKQLLADSFTPPSRLFSKTSNKSAQSGFGLDGAHESGANLKTKQFRMDVKRIRETSKYADCCGFGVGGVFPEKVLMFSNRGTPDKPAPANGNLGRLRWAVNAKEWQPEGEQCGAEFQFLLSLIQEDDRDQVLSHAAFNDQKIALISYLLTRRASEFVLGLRSFDEIEIAGMENGRPFLQSPRPTTHELANFNFSVAHAGDWVVLASEPLCICGIHIAPPEALMSSKVNVPQDFMEHLTAPEYMYIKKEADNEVPLRGSQPGYNAFQRIWSCKQSFLKASGNGADFKLERAGFKLQVANKDTAHGPVFHGALRVDNVAKPEWSFILQFLESDYWVAVARGPTDDVINSPGGFLDTLKRPTSSFSSSSWKSELERQSAPFDKVAVGWLVPADAMQGYLKAGGAVAPSPSHLSSESSRAPPVNEGHGRLGSRR